MLSLIRKTLYECWSKAFYYTKIEFSSLINFIYFYYDFESHSIIFFQFEFKEKKEQKQGCTKMACNSSSMKDFKRIIILSLTKTKTFPDLPILADPPQKRRQGLTLLAQLESALMLETGFLMIWNTVEQDIMTDLMMLLLQTLKQVSYLLSFFK